MEQKSHTKVEELKKVLEGKKKKEEERASLEGKQEPPPSSAVSELEATLKAAREEASQNHDRYLRLMADFENYKKRIAREQEERAKYIHEKILKDLLFILDDFDRVLEHLPEQNLEDLRSLAEGIHLIHRHFLKALKKFGLKEIEVSNQPFDPHWHEAIQQIETDASPEGMIVQCHRKGYKLHENLLRAALVSVAKPKACEKANENIVGSQAQTETDEQKIEDKKQ